MIGAMFMLTIKVTVTKPIFFCAVAALIVGLAACGGGGGTTASAVPGGGGGAPPALPLPPVTPLAATCTATAGSLTLSAGAARATGVAPLAVYFDATATTHTNPAIKPFHDIEYRWSFGDPGSGAWATGSRPGNSRNAATGPLASHVFEPAPGSGTQTYTITVTAWDGTNTAMCQVQVTVDDPNVVFAGANTICFSATGNFADAPAGFCTTPGVTQITTSDFDDAINTYLAQGKRLLFRADAGEVYTTSVSANLNDNGPWLIGKYGPAAKATVQRGTSVTIFAIGSGGTAGFGDGRVMDLDLDGLSFATANAFLGIGDFDQLTILRVSMHDVHNGVSIPATAPSLTKVWDQMAVVDSSVVNVVGGSGGVGIFGFATRFSLLGTTVNDASAGEHCVRLQWLQGAVISNNFLTTPASTKSTLTLRAPDFPVSLGPIPANTYSRWVVVSDNLINGGANVQIPFQIGGDGAQDSRNRDYVVERNFVNLPIGQTPLTGIMVFSSDAVGPVTVRNNIINFSGSATAGQTGVKVAVNGAVPSPVGVMVYNNTLVSSDAATTYRGVWIDVGASNSLVANNLVYAQNATTVFGVLDNGAATIASNNSSDGQAKTILPGFANPALGVLADYQVTSGYALNGGTPVPVFSDFFVSNRPQSGTWDIGATEQ